MMQKNKKFRAMSSNKLALKMMFKMIKSKVFYLLLDKNETKEQKPKNQGSSKKVDISSSDSSDKD